MFEHLMAELMHAEHSFDIIWFDTIIIEHTKDFLVFTISMIWLF